MLVEQLSEADVLAIPSSDIANVLMDLVLLTRVLVGCPRPIQLYTMPQISWNQRYTDVSVKNPITLGC